MSKDEFNLARVFIRCCLLVILISHAFSAEGLSDTEIKNKHVSGASIRGPRGLYATGWAKNMQNTTAFKLPYIGGVSATCPWGSLERAEGEYDWSYFDNLLGLAKKHNKELNLRINSGAAAPKWLFHKYDVKIFSWQWKLSEYAAKKHNLNHKELVSPLTWEKIYLEKFYNLIQALGDRYGNEDAIGYISLSGPGFKDFTMVIPVKGGRSVERLEASGYSEKKIIKAWKDTADFYAKALPNKKWALSVGPVIIGEKNFEIAYAVVDYALKNYQDNLVVMGVTLNDTWSNTGSNRIKNILIEKSGKYTYTGYMLAASAEKQRRLKSKRPLVKSLRQSFNIGAAFGIRFLEVWHNSDVILPKYNKPNPRFIDDLKYIHAELLKKEGPVLQPYNGEIGGLFASGVVKQGP